MQPWRRLHVILSVWYDTLYITYALAIPALLMQVSSNNKAASFGFVKKSSFFTVTNFCLETQFTEKRTQQMCVRAAKEMVTRGDEEDYSGRGGGDALICEKDLGSA